MPIKKTTDRKKYKKKYNLKNSHNRKREYYLNKEYLCFDGESEKDIYTLLGTSEKYIYDKKGLSSWDCFNFLWGEGKGKIKVIFAMHFDVQHWIRDLEDEKIIDILNGVEVDYYCYKIHYITKRMLILGKGKGKTYIYDFSSFFQTSFLNTVKMMKLNLSVSEKRILELGKKQRSKSFHTMSKKDIIRYNKTECIISEKICMKLRDILINTELELNGNKFSLYPTRFYGSGAVAKEILKNSNIEMYANQEKNKSREIREIIKRSYYGGRAENFRVGTFGKIYRYDINSAYPDVLSKLREPTSMVIQKGIKEKITKYNFETGNIYLIEWNYLVGDNKLFGVLPYRDKHGYVLFPKAGKGWYFGIECKHLNTLCKLTPGYFIVHKKLIIKYSEKLIFEKGFIEKIYEKRLELKKKKDISEIAYKLSLNSLYGKLAQQTGKREFTNILFASFITASTRSKMIDVVFENKIEKNLIQFATDGIFTSKKINKINIENKLGAWSADKFDRAIILGSGMYALFGKEKKYALRGYEVSKSNFMTILNKLEKNKAASVGYNAFIGHKFALQNYKAYGDYRLKFVQIKKTLRPFEYRKRVFNKANSINKISVNNWIDIFQGGEIIMSYPLKKFEFDLETEAILLETK